MKKNHFQARLCESLRSCRDRIALEYGDRFLSYAELDISSDSVANLIIREGIKKETFIGISFDDRVSFIRTLIGILKAGCVFVPLDLAHPDSRLTQMVKKTHIKYAFTDTGRIAFLTADWGITNLSEIEEIPESNSKPGRLYNGEDKIYIYFTSGSSGTPKAIVGKNKSLLHFINWEIDTFGIDETFRFSQFINPGFDAFLRDIFVPLCSGGRVCIPGSDNILLNSDELTRWTDRSAVNAIHCVPGFFRLLNNNNLGNGLFKNLKFVFLSGEKINPAGLVNWYNTFGERIRLVNFYGPSETTMIKTFYPIRQEDTKRERIPIGKPMKGARLIILDRKMKTCTGKRVGEIYIRTPFRTHGYYNERSLNEEKFISNPFNDDPEDKLYATGDIGRVLPGGDFELLGRNDRQVKIRGVRVELEEIENVLEKHPRVNEAVALKEEISSFNEQLCLFITTDRQDGKNEDADIAILKEYIKQELPAYMAPTRVEQVNEIPRNPNGKIDYKSLHSLLEAGLRDVVPPGNSMERRMRNIWSELLGIEEDNIGIRNSFLELGGNSLNAMTLSARVHREFHVRLSLAELFEHVTIEEQADRIRAASTEIYQSIKNAEEKEYYPLSSAQNRLFVVQQMEHGNTGYNTQTFVRLKGEVKREEFSRAFHKLIERHESLRTSFFMVAEVPVQKIHRPKEIEFEIEYFEASKSVRARRAVPGDQETGIIDRFVRPFDLSRAPLLRAGLIDTGSDEHILMVDMHHIAADGVSHGILIRDFTFLYEGQELQHLHIQYRDFCEWQKDRKHAETGQLKKQEEFWLGEFPGDIPVLNLPTDYVRPALQSFEGRVVRFTIAGNEKKALNRLALEQEVTLYMIVLALFNVLLAKLSGQEDIVVGSPTAGRDHADLQKVIGMFVNTLTLRSHPVAEKTFIDFLKEVKEKTLRAFENQDYPFEDLIEKVALNRDTARNPLFDVMFVLQNMGRETTEPSQRPPEEEEAHLSHQPYPYEKKISKFDMTLVGTESGKQIFFSLEYCTKLFKRETIERFATYFRKIVSSAVTDPRCRLADIEIIAKEEKRQILNEFNDTAAGFPMQQTVPGLFARQVRQVPDRTALIFKNRFLTYRGLDRESRNLGAILREKGVLPDTIVAIIAERSLELMVGLFGILQVAGAYLPIEIGYPAERIHYILKDSGASLLLTGGDLAPKVENFENMPVETVVIEEKIGNRVGAELAVPEPTNLAYVIYTSGSTGKPKGVLIEHRSLINRLNWMQRFYPIGTGDCLLQKTPVVFDVSLWELFWWALQGASLCLLEPGEEKNPASIVEAVEQNRVTTIHFVPSMFSVFLEYVDSVAAVNRIGSLRRIFTSGEALLPQQVNTFNRLLEWKGKAKLINLYGPTEATVDVSYYNCPADKELDTVPIGRPIENIKLFLVDKHFYLQPVGIAGELCIAGVGLARGYLNKPELTVEKFVDIASGGHPTAWGTIEDLLYRTGDLCVWQADGNIRFLGRMDNQVKIRGFRIELGEIESRLLEHPEIKEAVVLSTGGSDTTTGNTHFLCAYLVSYREHSYSEIKEYLSQHLPDYMIPSYFVELDELPRTQTGKINRKVLPDPVDAGASGEFEYIKPRSEIEKKLAEVWADVLYRDTVGINENFFMIGGDSIKAIQIVSRMHIAGYKLEMKDIFLNPVISDLVSKVKKVERIPDQTDVTGRMPLTPIQQRFFCLSRIEPHHYNQAVMLYSSERFDEAAVRTVFEKILVHHDALRMVFREKDGDIIQENLGVDLPLSLQVCDFRGQRDRENAAEILRKKTNEIQAGIDLKKGPLMKLGLFRMAEGDRLLIVCHHLVIDGVSWRILLEDMGNLYQQYRDSEPLKLPLKTDSFKTWSEALSRYADSETFLKEKAYWTDLESQDTSSLEKDFDKTDSVLKDTSSLSLAMSEEETGLLLTRANEPFGTEINDILLTALGLAVEKVYGQKRLLIALESHGREEIFKDIDINRTIGWFTGIYPVIIDTSYEHDLARQIKEIKETLHQVPQKGIGYGILKYLTGQEFKQEINFKLKPRLIFNYLGQFEQARHNNSFTVSRESTGNTRSPKDSREYELDVSGMISNNRLIMSINYSRRQFKKETIKQLLDNYKTELSRIIHYCAAKQDKEATPCDFTYKEFSIDTLQEISRITPGGIEDIYTLSPMQEGMLFHTLYDSSSTAYFEQMSFRLHGELDVDLVKKSLNELFKRYDILRTLFVYKGIEPPVQVVQDTRQVDFHFEILDEKISGQEERKEAYIKDFKANDRMSSFDLSRDVLMRVAVLKFDTAEFEFIWSFHHILMDGWCTGILIADFFEIYNSFRENRTFRLPQVTPYRIYIQWLSGRDTDELEGYWQNYLNFYENVAALPKTETRPTGTDETYRNEYESFLIERERKVGLDRLAGRNHVTLNTVIRTVWSILLGRYNDSGDVVFGAVVSGRPSEIEGIETMVGLFINTIPVRIRHNPQTGFCDLLRKVQEEAIESEPYHYYPLAEIQSLSALKQDLFDHILVFENYPIAEHIKKEALKKDNYERSGQNRFLEMSNVEAFEQSNYDFNIIVSPGRNRLLIKFQYNGSCFDREFVKGIVNHFNMLLDQVRHNEMVAIGELTLISEEERRHLLFDFNDTKTPYPEGKTIPELFEEQVRKAPLHIALNGSSKGNRGLENIQLSYRELDNRTRDFSSLLREKGAAGSIVGIMVERSIEMISGVLGILQAGGAYLPIDPQNPETRKLFMLKDSSATILLTTSDMYGPVDRFKNQQVETIFIEEATGRGGARDSAPCATRSVISSRNLAYVMYTSGSTGKPKAVMVEHINVVRLLKNTNYVTFDKENRLLQTGPLEFDASTFEIWGSLLNGLTLYLVNTEIILSAENLKETVTKYRITTMFMTTALFNRMTDADVEIFAPLKNLFAGGEMASSPHFYRVMRQYPNLALSNIYGPTENTTFSTFFPIKREGGQNIPIGSPIANSTVFIFDRNNRLVPAGIPGELAVGGDGVARGYLNNPELTAKKFIPVASGGQIPFCKKVSGLPKIFGDKLYKTGDLARWLLDGNIEFLGRIDNQVKIRGYRIELQEIESILLQYDGVKEAVVLAREDRDGGKYLCAYLAGEHQEGPAEIRDFLSRSLPGYMIPAFFIKMDKIPLTPNGKIDRGILPEPEAGSGRGKYAAPTNEIEETLAAIWSDVLGIDKDAVSIDDDFFELGGHSLKATAVVSQLHRELDVKIPLQDVFKAPTIKELAAYINAVSRDRFAAIQVVEKKEYYGLSSAQKRLFIQQQVDLSTTNYNINVIVELGKEVDTNRFGDAFRQLIERHESLRTSFIIINNEPVQKINSPGKIEFTIEYFKAGNTVGAQRAVPGEPETSEPKTGIIEGFIRPFDLSRSTLLRAGIIETIQEGHILIVDMHHIISDKLSQETLVHDFMALDRGESLEPLRLQYKDYSEWLNGGVNREVVRRQEAYWLKRFSGSLPILNLPTDFPRPKIQTYDGNILSFVIGSDETRALKKLAAEEGATMQIVMLSALNILLSMHSGQEDIIIGTPVAGRRHADLENIIGVFINTLALRNFPSPEKTYLWFLREVKANSLSAYENQDYEFEQLIKNIEIERDPGRPVLFDVMFEVRSLESPTQETAGDEATEAELTFADRNTDKLLFDMDWMGLDTEDRFIFTVSYNIRLFERESVVLMTENFRVLLGSIVDNVHCKIKDLEYRTSLEKEIGEVKDLEFNF